MGLNTLLSPQHRSLSFPYTIMLFLFFDFCMKMMITLLISRLSHVYLCFTYYQDEKTGSIERIEHLNCSTHTHTKSRTSSKLHTLRSTIWLNTQLCLII